MSDDLAFLPGLEQAKLIAKRELSPVELAELYLERIDRLNASLGAYLTVTADIALAQAKEAERAVANGADLSRRCPSRGRTTTSASRSASSSSAVPPMRRR